MGVCQIHFHPCEVRINSTTTNYITDTANLNTDKDNFRTLSFQGLFESIVQNLPETTLAAVFSGFSTLSVPIHKFKPLKGTTNTPVIFIVGGGGRRDGNTSLF